MSFRVTMKPQAKALVAKQQKAFQAANQDLKEQIIGEIASPVWSWPGTTVRQSGEIAGARRNIIDQGDLLDGYQEPRMQGKNKCVHVFTADHTLPVHEGATLRNGGNIPPRPFTERPAQNFAQTFLAAFKREP